MQDRWRFVCPKCTTYEIARALQLALAGGAAGVTEIGSDTKELLSSACQRATNGASPSTIVEFCLKLDEGNFRDIVAKEHSFLELVKPLRKYLKDQGVEVKGYRKFTHVEVVMPDGDQKTLSIESIVLVCREHREIADYCKEFDIAGRLAKAAHAERVEITKAVERPRIVRGEE